MISKSRTLRNDALLLLAAAVWGFAFVAQRSGSAHIEPFFFNGIRFTIGGLLLVPLALRGFRKLDSESTGRGNCRFLFLSGLATGIILFIAAALQQAGITLTSAGNAGFITGLYVVIVPFLGLFIKQRPSASAWFGAVLASVGLYFLSVHEGLRISPGDSLVLIGAFAWALHMLMLDRFSPRTSPLALAVIQFLVCGLISLIFGFFLEPISWEAIQLAALPLAYTAVLSVGVGYTLQVVAQKEAPAAHAAILLSMEAVFAAIGGYLLLDEFLGTRALFGCTLMLVGMLISQLNIKLFGGK